MCRTSLFASGELDKVIYALGILNVGKKAGKILAEKYLNLSNLMNATLDELVNLDDVGQITAESILDYLSDENNIKFINDLIKVGMNPQYEIQEVNTDNIFAGKTVVLTGKLVELTRNEAKEYFDNALYIYRHLDDNKEMALRVEHYISKTFN